MVLIEKKRFYLLLALEKQRMQSICVAASTGRIWSQSSELGNKFDSPERVRGQQTKAPMICEMQFRSIGKAQYRMRMRERRSSLTMTINPPAHAQVHQAKSPRLQLENKVLAPAMNLDNGSASQKGFKILRHGTAKRHS